MTGFFSQLSWTQSPSWHGWGSSLVVHAIAIGLAFLLTANVKPPPQKESFRWEVSLVSPPPSPETQTQSATKSSPTPMNKPLRQQRPIRHQQPVTHRIEKRQHPTRQSVQPKRSIVQTQRIQSVASVQHRSQVKTESRAARTIKTLAHTPSPRITRQEAPKQVRQSAQHPAHTVPPGFSQSRNEMAPTKTRQTAISEPPTKNRPVTRESAVVRAQSAPAVRQDSFHAATPTRQQAKSNAVPIQTHVVPQIMPTAKESPATKGNSKPIRTEVVSKDSPNLVAAVARQKSFATSRPVKTREALIEHRSIDTKSSSKARAAPLEKNAVKEEKAVNKVTALPHGALVRNVPVIRPMAAAPKETPTTKKSVTNGLSPEVLAFLKLLRMEIERARVYPPRARRMGLEGTTKVRFALFPNGELKLLKVAEPSGYPVLDAAALATVKKILPFHPPDTVELEGLFIEIPIKFWLR